MEKQRASAGEVNEWREEKKRRKKKKKKKKKQGGRCGAGQLGLSCTMEILTCGIMPCQNFKCFLRRKHHY
jgi:hypothetical protein